MLSRSRFRSHPLLKELSQSFLGPADVIQSLQDSVLEVLGKVLHCWARNFVGSGHWQGRVSTMIQVEWCLTQGQVH